MDKQTTGSVTTADQISQVRQLRAEGWTVRAIAAKVFGDAGYRGRVERILRASEREPAEGDGYESPLADEHDELSIISLLRLAFERRVHSWAATGRAPSMTELRGALDVHRRLDAFELLEGHRAYAEPDPEE